MRQIRGESKSLRMKIPEKRSNVGHSYLVALVILAAMCVGLDAFLVFRHWKTLSSREILLLAVPIGLQCAGQIWRLFRYRKAVEMITAEDSTDPSSVTVASKTVAGIGVLAISEILCWSFMVELLLLLYIGYAIGF